MFFLSGLGGESLATLAAPPAGRADCCASPELCHHMNCSMHARRSAARPSCHGESPAATESVIASCECSVSSSPFAMNTATGEAVYFQLPVERPLPQLAGRMLPAAEFQPQAAAGYPPRPELPPRNSCWPSTIALSCGLAAS